MYCFSERKHLALKGPKPIALDEAGLKHYFYLTSFNHPLICKSLSAGENIRLIQRQLYSIAKLKKSYRFCALYDHVTLPYFLEEAYRIVVSNMDLSSKSSQSFKAIEQFGIKRFLNNLSTDLKTGRYKPGPVRRIWIPKANGGERLLEIPTLRDRIAQMACKMVIEPIFEAGFEDDSYAFRPKRNGRDAIKAVKRYLESGKAEALTGDLSNFFDTILHDKLQKALELRIADSSILKLINLWMVCPVIEAGKMKGNRNIGISQGGVISPLLANIYLHPLDQMIHQKGSPFESVRIKMVRYADDFILLGEQITHEAYHRLLASLEDLGLILNKDKTQRVTATETPFNFLGFTISHHRDANKSKAGYWRIVPSEKAEERIRKNISICLHKNKNNSPQETVKNLNYVMRGWLHYYDISGVSNMEKSKSNLRYYLKEKLNKYYKHEYQGQDRPQGFQLYYKMVKKYGLINPPGFKGKNLPSNAHTMIYIK